MRIVIILGPFFPVPPVLGGATEKANLLLARAFREAGHNVTIISRQYEHLPEEQSVEGIRYMRVPSYDRSRSWTLNLLRNLTYSVSAARAHPNAEITVTNGLFLPLILSRRKSGKIYVQVGRYPKYQMCLYFRAARLQAVSQAVGDAIVRQAPWLKHRVSVVGCPISNSFFDSHAICPREKIILFVGRLAEEKGIKILLRAMVLLQKGDSDLSYQDWKVRIIGPHETFQGGDGTDYLHELKAIAQALGPQCEFVGPIFDEEALIREYRSSSIFVYPSQAERGEALGVAPLEAMAAGCAVIVSDLRCFDDYLVDRVTGLKFDHRSANREDNLALQLASLMLDPGQRERLASAGRAVAQRFRPQAIAIRMLTDFATL